MGGSPEKSAMTRPQRTARRATKARAPGFWRSISLASPTASISEGKPGLRERNKRDKLLRIREAARALFRDKGYDSTTIREIAARANVAPATVFLYAKEKRDLLYLIYRDDLHQLLNACEARVRTNVSFLQQLMDYLSPILEFWRPNPELARAMLREQFNLTGDGANDAQQLRIQIDRFLKGLLRNAQRRGAVRRDVDLQVLVDSVWANFRFYNDDWMRDASPDLDAGLRKLKTGLKLLLDGIATKA
jgi:AcrR family transcriptional regulator